MPFEIPTLPALVVRSQEDLQATGVDGQLRRSDADVLARVMAGGVFGLYGHQAWLALQILPDTCDEEMLTRWASLKRIIRTPATKAAGAISVTGNGATLIPAGFLWQTSNGNRVIVTADTLVSAGEVPVEAEEYGQAGNMAVGTKLSAVSPLAGLVDEAEVDTALSGGTDQEPLERWRRRVVRSFRIQPHGGDTDDYITWAQEVPGVTRAWCKPLHMGLGTVGVYFVRDDDNPITPDGGQIQAVKDHIESVRPVTADLYVMAPSLLQVDFQILITPDTSAIRARVEKAINDLFLDEADLGGRLFWSHITQAISNTAGEIDHQLVQPAADIVPAANELPVVGSITWL